MDIIKKIQDIKTLIEKGTFDTKHQGKSIIEVLNESKVVVGVSNIITVNECTFNTVQFQLSDTKTGITMVSDSVVIDYDTYGDLDGNDYIDTVKDIAIKQLMGIKVDIPLKTSETPQIDKTDNEVGESITNVENDTQEQNESVQEDVVEEVIEEKIVEEKVVEENTQNEVSESTPETKSDESSENTKEQEIVDNVDPLNSEYKTNPIKIEDLENDNPEKDSLVNRVVENHDEVADEKVNTEFMEKQEEQENVTPNEMTDNKLENHKISSLDNFQRAELNKFFEVTSDKNEKNNLIRRFLKKMKFTGQVTRDYEQPLRLIIQRELNRLSAKYTDGSIYLIFDEVYRHAEPETKYENLMLNLNELKVVPSLYAIVACQLLLNEMKY